MRGDPVSVVVSSKTRLRISDLLSSRPRTLKELAELSGVSIQGALKHLRKLEALGLVEERKVTGDELRVRKVYAARAIRVGDFSHGDLTVVKLSKSPEPGLPSEDPVGDLEDLAEEIIIRRREVQELTRKLGRSIDSLVDDEARVEGTLKALDLKESQRQILRILLSEDTAKDAEDVLVTHFGMKGGRRSIEKALAAARRNAKK
ncbi:MAG: helix-turn-helix domain-containing protein [Thaumarchaeota archaeon]|nr:helix-turn-helix domain-containing protein [Nitrososphaerota archaeon]